MDADVKTKIRTFVQDLLKAKGDDADLADSDSLFVGGRLDSVDAMATVVFLEKTFHLDFFEIGFDQFLIDSVDAIEDLVSGYRPSRS